MRLGRFLPLLVVTAVACSGGSDDDSSPADDSAPPTPVDTDSAPATDVVTDAPPATPVDSVGSSTTTASTDAPASTAAPTTVATTTTVAPTTTDRPLLINDAATVELGEGDGPTGDCAAVPRGVSDIVVTGGGADHAVRIFVPDELASTPAPVVLDFHGLGSDGPSQAAYSGYETLAAQEGFVAVHPTGVESSWELDQFDDPERPERDDLAFVDVLIDTVVGEWCGDPDRIYSTGMSNGGFFTARLLCERADRIAAAASIAGLSHHDGCEPARPVPYIAFHGTDDGIVPFDGDGDSPLALDTEISTEFFTQVMPEEFAEFAAAAGCSPEPTRTELTPDVIEYDYDGCDDGVPMTFYELPGSGHSWPNSPIADAVGGLGYHTPDIDATVDAWAFMQQFSL